MAKIPTTVKSKKLVKERREQIVRAAIKCFSQNGFHKTTLKDLADEAGISHGNFYKYISTKEEIFYLIHDQLFQQAIEKVKRDLNGTTDPVEKLRRLIRGRFELSNEIPGAMLLMYQEANVLKGELLKEVLADERRSSIYMENALEECVRKGIFRDINIRAISNLIVMMVDCWELKRWDLKGHINRLEFEQMVLDMVLTSLSTEKSPLCTGDENFQSFSGQSILVINAGGSIGMQVVSAFLQKGAKVIALARRFDFDRIASVCKGKKENIRIFLGEIPETVSDRFLENALKGAGPVDVVIHCVGETDVAPESDVTLARQLFFAQQLAPVIAKQMYANASGRIVYIAPDYWEKLKDPIQYEVVKGGLWTLSEELARQGAESKVTVNCVIPGFIRRFQQPVLSPEQTMDDIPMHEIGEVTDISNVVLFLVGDGARYVTGQSIRVSGGMWLKQTNGR